MDYRTYLDTPRDLTFSIDRTSCRRWWQAIQYGCVRFNVFVWTTAHVADSTVAYKQAALNAIAYLMKIGYSTSKHPNLWVVCWHCRIYSKLVNKLVSLFPPSNSERSFTLIRCYKTCFYPQLRLKVTLGLSSYVHFLFLCYPFTPLTRKRTFRTPLTHVLL